LIAPDVLSMTANAEAPEKHRGCSCRCFSGEL